MSRGSDSLLLPGEGDGLPSSLYDSDAQPASLRRVPSHSLDEQVCAGMCE